MSTATAEPLATDRSPATDPRIDRRLRAALAQWGLDARAGDPEVSRHSPAEDVLAAVAAAHGGFNGLYEAMPNDLPGDVEVPYESHSIAGPDGRELNVRVYRSAGSSGALPGVVYLHGGGMVILEATAKVHHRWVQDLAATGMVAVLVEYRNGYTAEGVNPFPAGLDDCVAAVRWVADHRDELGISTLVVQGESGGGNLTLATSLRAKREGWIDAIDGIYANVPYISGAYATWSKERKASELPSLLENDGLFLNCASMDHLVVTYDPTSEHAEDPLCWPYWVTASELAGMPPHVIAVNELDPLRDEGIAYYRKLIEAGVDVVGRVNLGLTHGADLIFRQAIPDVYFAGVADIRRFAGSL